MREPQNLAVNPRTSKTAYDLAAPFYDNWEWQRFWREYEYPIIREKIADVSRQSSTELAILDLGCGTGWYLKSLSDLTTDFRGIDISEGMIKIARSRVSSDKVTVGDIRTSKLLPNRYDVILVTRVLSHIEDMTHLFDQIQRAVRPFGIVILSDIDPMHNYKFTKLPYFDKSVFAETFKHSKNEIENEFKSRGFAYEAGYNIGTDGTIKLSPKADSEATIENPAGWITFWRQLRKKPEGRLLFKRRRKLMSVDSEGILRT